MAGISLALGAERAQERALVQGTGSALRMKAASFHEALERCVPLRRELHRYAYAKLIEARQTAACTRFHGVEERLARWLLMTHDRVRADRLQFTHAFLADMLGVRRAGVTRAASALQRHPNSGPQGPRGRRLRLLPDRQGAGGLKIDDHQQVVAAAAGGFPFASVQMPGRPGTIMGVGIRLIPFPP
jgi:hypothetical protein